MDNEKREYQKQYRREYRQLKKRVSITLSNAEYEALSFVAQQEDKKVTTLVREYTLTSLSGNPRVPESLKADLKELSLLIRNIANNVNQIARHSNRIHDLVSDDEHNLLLYLQSLDRHVKQFVKGQLDRDKS